MSSTFPFRKTLAAGAVLAAFMFPSTGVHAFQGDVVCGGKQHFLVPGECLQSCSKQKRSLANLSGGLCSFSASCGIFKGDSALKAFYNQAMFGRGAVTGQQGKQVLLSHVVNRYYKPHNVKNLDVDIGSPGGMDGFAGVQRPKRPGAKPRLTVHDDLFYTSPGYFVATIGHEMVHLEQHERTVTTNLAGINSVVGAMRELEASSWQSGLDNFPREFGPNKTSGCQREEELIAQRQTYECRKWQVKKAIENLRATPRWETYSKTLERWLNEDDWAKQVWLKQNPNWQSVTGGERPDKECSNP